MLGDAKAYASWSFASRTHCDRHLRMLQQKSCDNKSAEKNTDTQKVSGIDNKSL